MEAKKKIVLKTTLNLFFTAVQGQTPPPLLMEISFFMVPYIAEGNFPKLP